MSDALCNTELEQSFLAALARIGLSSPPKALLLLEQSLVVPDRLYDPAHREVLVAISTLLETGRVVDSPGLWGALHGSKAVEAHGGQAWLTGLLCSCTGHSGALLTYAETIRDLALRRMLVAVGQDLAARAADLEAPGPKTLSEVTAKLSSITVAKRELRTVTDYCADCTVEMEANSAGTREPVIATGLPSLDMLIGGLQPTLIVIGSLPAVGKSALLATLANNIAQAGKKVGVFSLEDEGRWLAWRAIAHESGVNQFILRHRRMTHRQLESVGEAFDRIRLYGHNILVDDRSALSPDEISQTARHMILNLGCRAIFVDHAGEMRFKTQRRDRYDLDMAEGLSDLREIAKRYRVPVVVAAHLKRRDGLDPEDTPKLTDFGNSSAFERQSRVAIGLSRESGSDELRITLLKQTNGSAMFRKPGTNEYTNTIAVRFVGIAAMVRDCERQIEDPYAASEIRDPQEQEKA